MEKGHSLRPGDFSTPNEKYFEHADWVIKKAEEKGFQVLARAHLPRLYRHRRRMG